MHIQLVGIPGSGKSFIVDYLISNTSYFIEPIKIKSLKSIVIKYPFVSFKVSIYLIPLVITYLFVFNKSPLSFKNKNKAIIGLFINICNYIINSKINYNKIIIWDEFIFQRLISMFGYDTSLKHQSLFRFYFNYLKKYNMASIFIKCEVPICFERIIKRGVPKRMDNIPIATCKQIMNTQQEIVKLLMKELSQSNTEYLEYINTQNPNAILKILAGILTLVNEN